MAGPELKREVSPKPGIQMVPDIDLARLADTVGERRSIRGEGAQDSITAIHCDSTQPQAFLDL